MEDYLRTVSSDPVTEWFTEVLREKNSELEQERQRADGLACALRAWYKAKDTREFANATNGPDSQLVNVLKSMGIIDA